MFQLLSLYIFYPICVFVGKSQWAAPLQHRLKSWLISVALPFNSPTSFVFEGDGLLRVRTPFLETNLFQNDVNIDSSKGRPQLQIRCGKLCFCGKPIQLTGISLISMVPRMSPKCTLFTLQLFPFLLPRHRLSPTSQELSLQGEPVRQNLFRSTHSTLFSHL